MTWWEVEQMTHYLNKLESGLEEWKFSNPRMRREKDRIDHLAHKIEKALPTTREDDKKDFLVHLADRIQELEVHLAERLKREVSRQVSPRNLLS